MPMYASFDDQCDSFLLTDDYYSVMLHCDSKDCKAIGEFHGASLRLAKRKARRSGWKISLGGRVLCSKHIWNQGTDS